MLDAVHRGQRSQRFDEHGQQRSDAERNAGPDDDGTPADAVRERILDVAYQAIVEKGFAATSIEELVEAAGITKSGYFYHFRDKNDMARQLFDRFLAEDEAIIDTLEKRAHELSDDPLQSFLIFLNLYAQMMDDMETLHPGCMVASVTYQERLFDAEVKRRYVDALEAEIRRMVGDKVFKLDEIVKVVVEARVQNIQHKVDQTTGKLHRVHTLKAVDAVVRTIGPAASGRRAGGWRRPSSRARTPARAKRWAIAGRRRSRRPPRDRRRSRAARMA